MEIHLQLVKTVARQVRKCLDETVKAQCSGCLVNHPSQHQHECIMLEGEDKIRFGLEFALTLVDWVRVRQDFWHHLSIKHMLKLPNCYNDVNWLQNLWEDETWKEFLMSALLN